MASYIIEEKAKDVKCSLSLYEEYTVLAFRYTATLQNVYQDILWAFQVDFLSCRLKTKELPKDAKFKDSLTECGIS